MSSSPTRFDPIIQAVTRRAEDIYTKMGIKRDESEDLNRKKRDNRPADSPSALWEDTTEVSLLALRGFLEDLLGEHTGPVIPQQTPPPPTTATTSPAAKAASAYAATGHVVHDRNVEPETPPSPPHNSSTSGFTLGDDFGEEERAMIRAYIKTLTALEARGQTTLTLRRSLTFLESIKEAIETRNS